MIGEKLYQRKSQARLFLAMYGVLALAGGALLAAALRRGQGSANMAAFMIVFGTGMFVSALLKSRRPQVLVYEEFLEVAQGRKIECVRYRNVTGVSRPDKNRLVVSLREEGGPKNVTVWTRELEPADVDRLAEFLQKAKGKRT